MKMAKRTVAALMIGTLLATGFLFLAADPASARTHFSFGLQLGVPITPYPAYAYPYPYPYPPPVHYAPMPYYNVYPPCARVWVPGYYDGYGNWVFGYYRYDCGYYGY